MKKIDKTIRLLGLFIFSGLLAVIIGCGEEPKEYYGPQMLYGVPSCTSDEQCIENYGENWYCNIEYESGYCAIKDSE